MIVSSSPGGIFFLNRTSVSREDYVMNEGFGRKTLRVRHTSPCSSFIPHFDSTQNSESNKKWGQNKRQKCE